MTFSLQDAARDAADDVALAVAGEEITYAALAGRAARAMPPPRDAQGRAMPARDAQERAMPARDAQGRAVLVPRATVEGLLPLYAALDGGVPAVLLHERFGPAEQAAALGALGEGPLSPGTAVVVFTSGTTGRPRPVALSGAALAASAAASAALLGWEPGDRWLLSLPPAHVGGLSIVTRCLLARRTVVLPEGPGPVALAAALQGDRVTLASLVPAQLVRLLDARVEPPEALRAVLVGGAAASPALLARARAAGWPVRATYGLTETCAQVATEPAPGAGLRALPGVELRIAGDGAALRIAGDLAEGPIEVRGAMAAGVALGPHGAVPLRGDDGWLRTADRGRLAPDGTLTVLGREDDVLVTGGENVDPLEVENALAGVPGVAAALVFGVPDPAWGVVVAALLVPEGGAGAPEAPDLPARADAALRARLASHKRPRLFALADDLPLTPAGKPDRRAARDRWATDVHPPGAP